MDSYAYDPSFDNQKLMYHPREVASWLASGATPGPVYTEFELCGRCNCRCTFCGVDHLVRPDGPVLDAKSARDILRQLHNLGNKSVMYCGSGEPLLNPHAEEIIAFGSQRMSASVTTNGLTLTDRNIALLDGLEWVRFSINGGDGPSYSALHQVPAGMFERALAAVEAAAKRKRDRGLGVTVGVQLVLLPENAATAAALARRVRELGADYFSVKPYSQHPRSRCRREIDYGRMADVRSELEAMQSESFRVVVRTGSAAKVRRKKPYGACYGTHFLGYISADGDVWECNVFAGDPRFRVGNVLREPLEAIWNGPRRREVLRFVQEELDLASCRDVCRMDECNRYLWRLRNPRPHDNFI